MSPRGSAARSSPCCSSRRISTALAALAESLRDAVCDLEVPGAGGEPITITASFGVAAYPEARTPEELLAAADAGLYRAKREGKNRVSSDPAVA